MASVNRVIILGNLGADPELKYTPNGNKPVCRLSVATSEVFKDRNGQKQERVEWCRVNVWGAQAEACGKYLAKGRSVYIEGRLQTRTWEDKDGSKRSATEIVAERVKFLGGGNGEQRQGGGGGGWNDEPAQPPSDNGPGIGDDDIPF